MPFCPPCNLLIKSTEMFIKHTDIISFVIGQIIRSVINYIQCSVYNDNSALFILALFTINIAVGLSGSQLLFPFLGCANSQPHKNKHF